MIQSMIKQQSRILFLLFFTVCLLSFPVPASFAQSVSFGNSTSFSTGGSAPSAVVAGDLNGDGKLDLAATNYGFGSDTVSILLGDGTGSFGTAQNFSVEEFPYSVAIGDFNRDGRLDLAVGHCYEDVVEIYINNTTPGSDTVDFTEATYSPFTAGETPVQCGCWGYQRGWQA